MLSRVATRQLGRTKLHLQRPRPAFRLARYSLSEPNKNSTKSKFLAPPFISFVGLQKATAAIVLGSIGAGMACYGYSHSKKVNAEEEQSESKESQSTAEETTQVEEENVAEERKREGRKIFTFKYVIVGGGTTAYSAAQELKARDPEASILIVTEESHPPYQRPPLSKELWKSEDPEVAKNLIFKDFTGKESSVYYPASEQPDNISILRNTVVVDIDVVKKAILLHSNAIVKYDKCLIATGGEPRRLPGVPEELEDKVTTYRTLDDFIQLDKISRGAKEILVIGGGFLGSELACGLAMRGKQTGLKVVQVFPESGLMALAFPKYLSDYTTEKIRKDLGIDIRPGTLVKSVSKNGVAAIGIKPNIDLAFRGDLEIDPKNGGILVNAELQARSDLYAAGDVVSYHDIILGRRRVEHYDHAVNSGKHAAKNMTGARLPYYYMPMFWSDIGDIGYEAVGIIDSSLETVSVWERPEGVEDIPANPEYKRGLVYYLKDNKVVGVILWGAYGKVDDARALIKRGRVFEDRAALKNAISLEEEED